MSAGQVLTAFIVMVGHWEKRAAARLSYCWPRGLLFFGALVAGVTSSMTIARELPRS